MKIKAEKERREKRDEKGGKKKKKREKEKNTFNDWHGNSRLDKVEEKYQCSIRFCFGGDHERREPKSLLHSFQEKNNFGDFMPSASKS
jgi:hypothetical protein